MQLPLRQFADIVETMKRSGTENAGTEQRRAARMPLSAKVQVHPVRDQYLDGDSFSAILRDISLTGVGLLQSKQMNVRDSVILALPSSTGLVYPQALVTHCQGLADGIYFLGLKFTQILDDATFAQLIKESGSETARLKRAILG